MSDHKPFKGVIRKWKMIDRIIFGSAAFDVDSVPLSTEAIRDDRIVQHLDMRTSRVVRIEDRGTFKIAETQNSYYVLLEEAS